MEPFKADIPDCQRNPSRFYSSKRRCNVLSLKNAAAKNKIPAQLPEGVGTANKTGELDTVENDAAIIYDTAKGIDLVVCFMSQDLTDTGAAQSTIAADARAIYGYYNE